MGINCREITNYLVSDGYTKMKIVAIASVFITVLVLFIQVLL